MHASSGGTKVAENHRHEGTRRGRRLAPPGRCHRTRPSLRWCPRRARVMRVRAAAVVGSGFLLCCVALSSRQGVGIKSLADSVCPVLEVVLFPRDT